MDGDIPQGLTKRVESSIPRRLAIDEVRAKADALQKVRDDEVNHLDLTNVKTEKKFKIANSNSKGKVELTAVQQQYNNSFSNPFQSQTKNEKLARLIEERARAL